MGSSQNPLKRLVHEIHDRSLWQVLAIYVAAAWVVFEVVQTLTEGLGLPDWVPPLAFVLLLIGLPIVLATAFVQQGAPELGQTGRGARWHEIDLGEPDSGRRSAHRVFTWRNSAWFGIGALAFVGLASTGYMASRTLGVGPFATPLSAGELEEKDRIVLADFETRTVDSTLARAVTEAFRADLSQSPTVKLADEAHVSEVLRRMEQDPETTVDFETAREAAVREGFAAVIGGEIDRVGSRYSLSARLVTADSGKELAAVRETAEDEDGVLPAIERLSRTLRERIGESLTTVRASPPLRRVRTASLEALERYTEASRANERGDYERCVTLLDDALSIDSLFAAAYLVRSFCHGNMGGHRAQQVQDGRRAFELRARMTEGGRVGAINWYHGRVTGETEKAIEATEAYLDVNPDDTRWLNNLSVRYSELGQDDRAEEVILPLFDGPAPARDVNWLNLVGYQIDQGKFEEAEETLDRWEAAIPDSWRLLLQRARLAFARDERDAAENHVRRWRDQEGGSPYHRRRTSLYLGWLALIEGKLAEAASHYRDAMRASEESGVVPYYYSVVRSLAHALVWVGRDPAQAREVLDEALIRHPLASVEALDRRYALFATPYAMAGRPARAQGLLHEFRDSIPRELWGRYDHSARVARGWLAIAEGRLDEAMAEFQPPEGPRSWALDRSFALGVIYDRVSEPDSAIAHFETFLRTPYVGKWLRDARWRALVLERLGQLYEHKEEPGEAVEYYSRFVELWEDADPELQPRVEEARQRVAALTRVRSEGH